MALGKPEEDDAARHAAFADDQRDALFSLCGLTKKRERTNR
jgi:hypothetical protein